MKGVVTRPTRDLFLEARHLNMRAKLDAETLLQIILVLIVVWLVLIVIDATLGLIGTVLGLFPFTNLIGLLIAVLIILWLLDRI